LLKPFRPVFCPIPTEQTPLTLNHQTVKKHLVKITSFGLIAAVLALAPGILSAQDTTTTNAPAQTTPKKAKKYSLRFHGKVSAVDAGAETLTVRTLTLKITSTTRIVNATNGEPAILTDISVGETSAVPTSRTPTAS
jgi:hypothetical protein